MHKKRSTKVSKESPESIPKFINFNKLSNLENSYLHENLKLTVLNEVYFCSPEKEIKEDLVYPNGFYTGQTIENKREGLGIFFSTNRFTYHGFWKNDVPDGPGILKTKKFRYEGFFVGSKFDGFGIYENEDYFFKGNWISNERYGGCKEIYKKLDIKYKGKYKNDVRTGTGNLKIRGIQVKIRFKNGKLSKGNFESLENKFEVKFALDQHERGLTGVLEIPSTDESDEKQSIEFLYQNDELSHLQHHLVSIIP